MTSRPAAARPVALTTSQLAIWVDQALHPGKPIYNTGQILTIDAALDLGRFAQALRLVVAENDALRLRFVERASKVLQRVDDEVAVGFEFRDFSGEGEPEGSAGAWLEDIFWIPLNAMDFPLFRFGLAKVGEARYLWLQKYHHLIIDATGRYLVAARTAAIYDALVAGRDPHAGKKPSFATAVATEEDYLASPRYRLDAAYWSEHFPSSYKSAITDVAGESERSRSGRSTRLACALKPEASDRLRAHARTSRSSVFKILVALVWACFNRLYGTSDLTFGVALANRSDAAAKETVGLFAKVLPFRPGLKAEMSLEDALAAIDERLGADLLHKQFPISHIMRSARSRGVGQESLFDVSINYVRNDYTFDFGGSPVACRNISAGFAFSWSIMALDYSAKEPIRIIIDYDQGRVAKERAARFVRCLEELLGSTRVASAVPLGQLPMGSRELPSQRIATSEIGGPLAAPRNTSDSTAAAASRQDDISAAVLGIWRAVFDDLTLSYDAHFMELGGDSLKAVLIMNQCNTRFGIKLPLSVLFEQPTVEGIAEAIRAAAPPRISDLLAVLRRGGDETPLLFLHPIGGDVFCYRHIVERLEPVRPVYGIRAFGAGADKAQPQSIEELAGRYVDAASRGIDHQPWHLAGWSFGGLVAFEMARQLAAAGRPAASLTVIDTAVYPGEDEVEDERFVARAVAGALGVDLAATDAKGEPTLDVVITAANSLPGYASFAREQVHEIEGLVRALRRLRRRYRPRPLAGAMTLLRAASDRATDHRHFDWQPFVDGTVHVITLPATHDTIVLPPHADRVAAALESAFPAHARRREPAEVN